MASVIIIERQSLIYSYNTVVQFNWMESFMLPSMLHLETHKVQCGTNKKKKEEANVTKDLHHPRIKLN